MSSLPGAADWFLGICNGFQILCEVGLLPGALVRNVGLQFICQPVHLRVEETDTPFTRNLKKGQLLKIPIKHGEGCYFADAATLESHAQESANPAALCRCQGQNHAGGQSQRLVGKYRRGLQ